MKAIAFKSNAIRIFLGCVWMASMNLSFADTFIPGPASGYVAPAAPPQVTVNEAGLVAGTQQITGSAKRAINWSPATSPTGTTLAHGTFADAFGVMLSETGATVGYGVLNANITLPLRWETNGTLTTLGTLTASSTGAIDAKVNAVSPTGLAIGYSKVYDDTFSQGDRAVVWYPGTTNPVQLPIPSLNEDFGVAQARVISNSGIIAGDAQIYNGSTAIGQRAVRWTNNNTIVTVLDTISLNSGGIGFAEVKGLNDLGIAAGNARKYSGTTDLGLRAIRWAAGTAAATELGHLGTTATGANADTTAIAIDRYGNIAGLSQKYVSGVAKGTRPVIWRSNSTVPIELAIYGLDTTGAARGNMSAMNNGGWVAGTMGTFTSAGATIGRRAIVWSLDGTSYNLNDMIPANSGWILTVATDISDSGWVAGYGTFDPDGAGPAAAYDAYFSFQSDVFRSYPAANASNLAISKIMYLPSAPSAGEVTAGHTTADAFEFIELINIASTPIDLMGVYLQGQVNFDFTQATTNRILAPGARILVASNKAAFDFRYGTSLPVAGSYTGNLSNSGGTIALYAYNGEIISDITYSTTNGWPTEASQGGYSLVQRHPTNASQSNDPGNWRASVNTGGAPGTSDAKTFTSWKTTNSVANDNDDLDHDGFTAFQEYAQGTNVNQSDAHTSPKISTSTFTVAGVPNVYPVITYQRRFAADDVTDLVQVSSTLLANEWASTGTVFISSTKQGEVETVVVRSATAISAAPRHFYRVQMKRVP